MELERLVVHGWMTQEYAPLIFAIPHESIVQRQWDIDHHRHCPVLFAVVGLSHSSSEVPVVGESKAELLCA